ncbi:hypothetical protein AALA17_04125 [Lactobacillaceae bacterium 24-114]
MQFDTKTVNKLLDIDESYKAPERMLQLMLNDQKRPELFEKFLEISTDLKFDWFHEYFEDEQKNDGYCSPVTERDLAVNGPIEPENYAEETILI